MFDLYKGNEKDHAVRDDAASLLVILKFWIMGVETGLQLLD